MRGPVIIYPGSHSPHRFGPWLRHARLLGGGAGGGAGSYSGYVSEWVIMTGGSNVTVGQEYTIRVATNPVKTKKGKAKNKTATSWTVEFTSESAADEFGYILYNYDWEIINSSNVVVASGTAGTGFTVGTATMPDFSTAYHAWAATGVTTQLGTSGAAITTLSPVIVAEGPLGAADQTDGSGSYDIAVTNALADRTRNMTVMVLFKAKSGVGASYTNLLETQSYASQYLRVESDTNGGELLGYSLGGGNDNCYVQDLGGSIRDNRWHAAFLICRGSEMATWLDGIRLGTVGMANGGRRYDSAGNQTTTGIYGWGGGNASGDQIAAWGWWTRALSWDEILSQCRRMGVVAPTLALPDGIHQKVTIPVDSNWLARTGSIAFDFTYNQKHVGGEYLAYLGSGDNNASGWNIRFSRDGKLVCRAIGLDHFSTKNLTWTVGVKYRFVITWDGWRMMMWRSAYDSSATDTVFGDAGNTIPANVSTQNFVITGIHTECILGAGPSGVNPAPGVVDDDENTLEHPTLTAVRYDRWQIAEPSYTSVAWTTAPAGGWVRSDAQFWEEPYHDSIILSNTGVSPATLVIQGQPPDISRVARNGSGGSLAQIYTDNPLNNLVTTVQDESKWTIFGSNDWADNLDPVSRTRLYRGVDPRYAFPGPHGSGTTIDTTYVARQRVFATLSYVMTALPGSNTRTLLDTRRPDGLGGFLLEVVGSGGSAGVLRITVRHADNSQTQYSSASITWTIGRRYRIRVRVNAADVHVALSDSVAHASSTLDADYINLQPLTKAMGSMHTTSSLGANNQTGVIGTIGGTIENLHIIPMLLA